MNWKYIYILMNSARKGLMFFNVDDDSVKSEFNDSKSIYLTKKYVLAVHPWYSFCLDQAQLHVHVTYS